MGDVVLSAETGHLLAGEISSVVGDDSGGIPKRHTMFWQRNLTICCSLTLESGAASICLVK